MTKPVIVGDEQAISPEAESARPLINTERDEAGESRGVYAEVQILRAKLAEATKALDAVAQFMRKDVQSGDSDLWTPEYEALHDCVIVALRSLTDTPEPDEGEDVLGERPGE